MNNTEVRETITSDGRSTDATPDAVKPDTTTNPTDTDATTPDPHDDTQQDNPSAAKASREAMKYRQALRAKTEEYDRLKQRYDTIRRRLVGDALTDAVQPTALEDAVNMIDATQLDGMFDDHGHVNPDAKHAFEQRLEAERPYMLRPQPTAPTFGDRRDDGGKYRGSSGNGGLRAALKAARH